MSFFICLGFSLCVVCSLAWVRFSFVFGRLAFAVEFNFNVNIFQGFNFTILR